MTSNWTGYALVAIGGAFGAMARMGVGNLVRSVAGGPFPWHTFAINLSGSLALGFAATWFGIRAMPGTAALNHLVAIGFLGAYTTFSTFELETWNLVTEGRWAIASVYVIGSVAAGFAGLAAGVMLGRALA